MVIIQGIAKKIRKELVYTKGPESCLVVVNGAEFSFPSLYIPYHFPICTPAHCPSLTESVPAPASSWHGPDPVALQAPPHTWCLSFQPLAASAPALPAARLALPDTWAQREDSSEEKSSALTELGWASVCQGGLG